MTKLNRNKTSVIDDPIDISNKMLNAEKLANEALVLANTSLVKAGMIPHVNVVNKIINHSDDIIRREEMMKDYMKGLFV